jgi:AraC-like DNA-binding protein
MTAPTLTASVLPKELLPRSTASARVVLQVAVDRGLGHGECLRDTGLGAEHLLDPMRLIRASQEERLIQNMLGGLGDHPSIGLDAGSRYSLPTFGMFGLAMLSAATPREMIEVSIRYQALSSTLGRARMVRTGGMTFIEIDTTRLADPIQNFVADHVLAVVWSHTCALDGVPERAAAELRRQAPRDLAMYRNFFGWEPTFGATVDRIGFSDAYLDRPRLQVDPAALRNCVEQCEALMRRRLEMVRISGVVRERLGRAAPHWPTLDAVAADLHVSTRTLERRLAAEGTSFREIDDAARRERAEHLLRETADPIDQIAYAVGYATSSAFVRAFKRWHARPPGAWRVENS